MVGAHYLPFVTLYGLPIFAIAGGLMVTAGILLPSLRPGEFAIGGWLGAVLLALLAAEGVTDFEPYAVSPGTPLMPDFFVPAAGARTVVGRG